ncbi:MAG: glycosyltransferase family 2 protein [Clostridia bacterium]
MHKLFAILDVILVIGIVLFLLAGMPKLIYYVVGMFCRKTKPLPPASKNHKFAVIIPARNESAVITTLLESLKAQTFPREFYDIFIAVEKHDDPTCEIAKKYDAEVYFKQDFSKNGKGFVLEEVVDHITTNHADKNYEAYFIVDADNILNVDYLEKMNQALDAGYDICLGNRNAKNWNGGWLAACTGLNFIRFSHFQNFARSKFGITVLLSGTCYYIKTDIVKAHGGWQWHSLTEDVELTTVSALNNYKTHYIDDAVFFDEQPTDLHTSFNQRKRWVKGYFINGSVYNKEIYKGIGDKNVNRGSCLELALGASCMVSFAVAFITYLLTNFIVVFLNLNNPAVMNEALARFIVAMLGYAAVLYVDTIIMLFVERKNITMKWYRKLETIFMRPIYSMLYVPIAFAAIVKPVEWVPIEHKVNSVDQKKKQKK